MDLLYTLTLSNAERIMLRRLLREEIAKDQALACMAIKQKNYASAESIVDGIATLESTLDKVRQLQSNAIALQMASPDGMGPQSRAA